MANLFKIPLLTPFKFVPNTTTPGIHFDSKWMHEQIRDYEISVRYKQKWKKSDTTKLQIISSIAPSNLKLYRPDRTIAKQFVWTAVFTTVSYKIYETIYDVSDQDDGIYFLFQGVTLLAINWPAISEPIHIKSSWPNTILIKYRNSFNAFGVAFTATGIEMKFRVEAGITDYTPERDREPYVDQTHNVETISATPYRGFTLSVGDARGVSNWVVDLLNRITCCDHVLYEDKQYETEPGAKFEITRVKGYPLIGASIRLLEANNNDSLEFSDQSILAGGAIIEAYNIDTDVFGAGSIVPIIEVLEN